MGNRLYYGDNLDVLRASIASGSVDLIYLDPPFNSNASYNVLFKAPSGAQSQAQIEAFDDTWHWNESAERAFDEVLSGGHSDAAILLKAMRSALGENDMMAYLAMMAVRLIELHRVLKPTGSIYLHCDPTGSHYLKILMDAVFGAENFRADIIWKRQTAHSDATTKFASLNDNLLLFGKSREAVFNVVREPLSDEYVKKFYKFKDSDGRRYQLDNIAAPEGGGMSAIRKDTGRPNGWYVWKGFEPPARGWRFSPETMERLDREGRLFYPIDKTQRIRLKRYLDENKGQVVGSVWTDIPPLHGGARELLGYPTQKPLALLERVISASSNEGDVVLDPFCGCGTTVHAAQKLRRQWIGIDVTHLAIALIERRLKEAFPGIAYEVHGVPKDADAALDLAARDKHEFQKWIVATIGGQPYKGGKKGMDRGIDGYLHFRDADNKPQLGIISVKGGATNSGHVRDLKGTMEREGAKLGVFLTLNPPTREMEKEAASAGLYDSGGGKLPRLQILTAANVIQGKRPRSRSATPKASRRRAANPRITRDGCYRAYKSAGSIGIRSEC